MKTAELYIDIRPYLKSFKLWLGVIKRANLRIEILNIKVPKVICRLVLYMVALQLCMLARHRILLERNK